MSVTVIGFVTHGRPGSLRRALESHARNARDHGRHPRLVVADDSASADDRRANRAALTEIAREYGLEERYVGPEEKDALAAVLVRATSVPPDVVRFALCGDASTACRVGANRNALLLSCTGALVLCSDDDIVARVVASPESRDAPDSAYAVHTAPDDPCRYQFYDSRAGALEAHRPVDDDLLWSHGRWLGRILPLPGAAGPVTRTTPARPRVLATLAGILGDSGFSCSTPLLYATSPAVRASMTAHEARYRTAMTSRELLRVVAEPTLARPTPFFAGAVALDVGALLPPFLPVGRNEDGLFGRMLGLAFDDACCMHLPVAMLHAPVERGAYASSFVEAARVSRFAELVLAAALDGAAGRAGRGAGSLAAIGERLESLAALAPDRFASAVRSYLLRVASAKTKRMQAALDAGGPEYWRRDVLACLTAVRESVESGHFFTFPELSERADDALRIARRIAGRFGSLLGAWASLFEAASNRDDLISRAPLLLPHDVPRG